MTHKLVLLFLAAAAIGGLCVVEGKQFGNCPPTAVAQFKQLGQSKKYLADVKSKCGASNGDPCYRKCLCFVMDSEVLATLKTGVRSNLCEEASNYYLIAPHVPKSALAAKSGKGKCGKLNCSQLGPPLTGH